MDLEFIKTAFLTLFVAVDPPGLATLFLSLTAHLSLAQRKSVAVRAVVIAWCILTASALGGKDFLEMLGVSIPAFRIAGGLLLFSIAAEMVFERREARRSNSAEVVVNEHKSLAAFPLAMPLMAGPGAITATILQASHAQGSIMNIIALMGVVTAVIGCCFISFRLANHIDKILGVSGRMILARLLGVLLAAIAVQTVGDGVFAFIASKQ
ncbi:MAG: MarC family protein [Alphaproteobacteria bacterium]|nr:MarC family protein [Alphaproteobacteria bacterium]